ncbi:hypothetical protein [Streptomyces syringium]|uniref:hypothetical protein n=1 Tax=Streptomyces syringium TaxID=76729 RepID=UPI0033DF02D4
MSDIFYVLPGVLPGVLSDMGKEAGRRGRRRWIRLPRLLLRRPEPSPMASGRLVVDPVGHFFNDFWLPH